MRKVVVLAALALAAVAAFPGAGGARGHPPGDTGQAEARIQGDVTIIRPRRFEAAEVAPVLQRQVYSLYPLSLPMRVVGIRGASIRHLDPERVVIRVLADVVFSEGPCLSRHDVLAVDYVFRDYGTGFALTGYSVPEVRPLGAASSWPCGGDTRG